MGYYCVFIQISERILMDLDEEDVPDLFERAGAPDERKTSLSMLMQYEQPPMADRSPPPMGLERRKTSQEISVAANSGCEIRDSGRFSGCESPISLEKMWLALHHLLTGEFGPVPSPLSRAILGGKAIGADVGDGPARYIWADEVREISTALSALTHEELRKRFVPARLKAEWPLTPVDEEEDDQNILTELEDYFAMLATYYRIAAARGNAMLIGVV